MFAINSEETKTFKREVEKLARLKLKDLSLEILNNSKCNITEVKFIVLFSTQCSKMVPMTGIFLIISKNDNLVKLVLIQLISN